LYEIGLATGVDAALPDSEKLQVNADATGIHEAGACSAAWAFHKFTDANKKDYVAGAYTAVTYGFATRDSGDSHAMTQIPTISATDADAFKSCISEASVKRALMMIVATKVNWWTTNHHTGTGALQGFARKAAYAVLGANENNEAQIGKAMYTVGHWCSTRQVLSLIGVKGLKVDRPYFAHEPNKLTISDDVILRLNSMPAGTHKHAVAFAITKRLINHIMSSYSGVLADISGIIFSYHRVQEDRAKFHIGAMYLTGGKVDDFTDSDADGVLGRLATFVMTFFPNSTIAGSPHISKIVNGKRVSRAADYSDFDDIYSTLCANVRQKSIDINPEAVMAEVAAKVGTGGRMTDARIEEVRRLIQALGVINTSSSASVIPARPVNLAAQTRLRRLKQSFADLEGAEAYNDLLSNLSVSLTNDEATYFMDNRDAVIAEFSKKHLGVIADYPVAEAAKHIVSVIAEMRDESGDEQDHTE